MKVRDNFGRIKLSNNLISFQLKIQEMGQRSKRCKEKDEFNDPAEEGNEPDYLIDKDAEQNNRP